MRVIHVLRKPLEKANVAENVLAHGCGALNMDACRVSSQILDSERRTSQPGGGTGGMYGKTSGGGFGGYVQEGERHNADGRWPANLILEHRPGCRKSGTRRVPTGVAVNRNKDGTSPKGMWGFAGQQGPDQTFGDGDGMETVDAWDCTPDCPVADLDDQSGDLAVSWRRRRGTGMGYGSSATSERGESGHRDRGGASRFFFQVHEADE